MNMIVATFLCTCLFLMAPGILTSDPSGRYPFHLVVYNSIKVSNKTYTPEIAYRGILIGAMRRLQQTVNDFNFTVEETDDYGPYLVSVNGLAGDQANRTYWELLVELHNGTIIRPDVGVGCYIPKPNEKIVFKYTTW